MGQQGRYIGRVGALAVALGIGGVIAALPAVATADTGSGDSGKTTSSAGKHAPRNAGKPAPRAQKTPAAAVKSTGTVSAASRVPLDRLGTSDPLAPVTESLSWAVLAVSRRERIAGSARLIDVPGRATTTSAPTSAPSASDIGDPPVTAGATASPALNTAVRNFIDEHLPGWSAIADELAPIVADGIQDLVTNGAVSAEVQRLVANDAIRQFVSTKISTALNSYFGVPSSVGTVVGNSAVNLVRTVLGNAGVQGALDVLANAVRPTQEQYAAIVAGLAVDDVAPLGNYLKSMVATSSDEIAAFLSDATVRAALASATSQAVIDLTSGPALPTWLGDVTGGWLSQALGGGAAAEGLGTAVGNAVQGLLSNAGAMQGLATVAGAAVTNILGTPGVPAALADAITQFGTGVLAGSNWIDALDVAWQGLLADSSFRASLGPAAGSAVYSLATSSGVVSALGSTVTALVNDVAGNAAVRTLIGDILGPTYGPTVVNTLADPASAAALAATAGSVVTSFLGQTGVAAALSAAANQIVTALLSGVTLTDAVLGAFQSLQANAAVVAAFNATVPDALQGVLKAPAVRDVISVVAQGVVVGLLDKTPLNNSVLEPLAGQVTKAAVDALVSNPAAQGLIGDLAGDLLGGTPPADVVQTVIAKVVTSPPLQIALGQALGQGFGALFGDNPIAFAVGQLAGAATALFLVLGFAVANPLFGLAGGLAASAVPSGSSYFVTLQIA